MKPPKGFAKDLPLTCELQYNENVYKNFQVCEPKICNFALLCSVEGQLNYLRFTSSSCLNFDNTSRLVSQIISDMLLN